MVKHEKKKVRVLLADDHLIFRTGLRTLLKADKHIEIVGEASNGAELLANSKICEPDVVLTDIVMPDIDGVMATKELCSINPHPNVIALSMFGQEQLVIDMLDAGAIGYLLKTARREEVVEAIENVDQNKPYFCSEISTRLTEMLSKGLPTRGRQLAAAFSEREKEIICLLCREFSNKEIAAKLGLSKRTVEGHRQRIMDKIGVRGLAGIITYAIRTGIYEHGSELPRR